jgi:hypothetical protein
MFFTQQDIIFQEFLKFILIKIHFMLLTMLSFALSRFQLFLFMAMEKAKGIMDLSLMGFVYQNKIYLVF